MYIYNVQAWNVGKKYGIKKLILGSINVIVTYMQLQPSIPTSYINYIINNTS